ncbi:MAG: hypothetical protein LUG18_00140 [Candidatus Azobacteroides sp.]|nr:hypothetical protein [Candidatus Azobacteroides sp.]
MKNNILLFVFTCLMAITTSVSAQVGINTETPHVLTDLDIQNIVENTDTTYRGIMIPRMTEEARDAMTTGLANDVLEGANSLLIFNTTENCYNYYNATQSRWLSLCGSLGDAEFTGTADCNRITVYGEGTFYANIALNTNQYITLPVTVTSPGNYTIIANSNNGYGFTASGIFPEAGDYTVTLQGIGTPIAVGIDNITFMNGQTPLLTASGTEVCTKQLEIKSTIVNYIVDCNNITVTGNYIAGEPTSIGVHYVTIPLTVENDGTGVTISTNTVNGLRFTGTENLVAGTTTSIQLNALGTPLRAGTFTYVFTTTGATITTCSFTVTVNTTIGTFNNPAKNCLAIYNEDSSLPDGEYYIQSAIGEPTRTFCDMTNGGYTLIWSYSERTVYSDNQYGAYVNQSIGTYERQLGFRYSIPSGVVTTDEPLETNILPYQKFRLAQATMALLKEENANYHIRITEDPTDMTDPWALLNFLRVRPLNNNFDFITATSGEYTQNGMDVTGKILGRDYTVNGAIKRFNGAVISTSGDPSFYYFQAGSYPSHINWGAAVSFTPITPAGTANETATIPASANLFGVFRAATEGVPNHHFGKCGGNAGSETDFTIPACYQDLYPHAFNNGEGRILQWFVK